VQRAQAKAAALATMPALSAFQRRMEQYPQLTPDAQAELAADFQKGEDARSRLELAHREKGARGAKRLSPTAERRAKAEVRRGEWAMEHLLGSCFKLVLLICRENAEERYGRERAYSLLEDLVADANLAVTEAARSFDPVRCPVFSTYAARVVRDRVRMVLTKQGPMRLAPSWSRLKRIASVRVPQLAAELGRQPTDAEVRQDLLEHCLVWAEKKLLPEQQALPESQKYELKMAKLRKQGMLGAIENLDDVMLATQAVASLDRAVGADGSAALSDLVPETASDSTFDGLELGELRDAIGEVLMSLPDRDREIILYRYGFVDGDSWTYAKIAERYDVTAERIRQIERNVLQRLASPHGGQSSLSAFLPSQFGEDD
jgi:RNA polymerase sigma factor (sigma-70 family)